MQESKQEVTKVVRLVKECLEIYIYVYPIPLMT